VLRASLIFIAVTTAAFADPYGVTTTGTGWIYTRLGNQNDVQTTTSPGIMFEGGGTDVNSAYQWMCHKANGGDFLVIRTGGDAAYNPYIQRLCPGINSVSTLRIYDQGASQPFVFDTIMQAEALFIAGGNQAQYVRFWQDTPVNQAINALAAKGVPIGGTSAGNAILAQFAYSALHGGSETSSEALANPFNFFITIDNGFLNLSSLLENTITDDHFVTRDRMGRLVTFLARIIVDGSATEVSGIALDEETAFLMEPDGTGTAVGTSTVYFLRSPGPPQVCQPFTPLTYSNVSVYRIAAGGTFNIAAWTGSGGTAYTVSAVNGVLQSTQPGGAIY
jgi:cyanophycinase